MAEPIYLDYQATTPLAPEVWAAMTPWLRDKFANPHSAHRLGREAAAALSVARDKVAGLLPSGGEVIFTSGATEAINLAILGYLRGNDDPVRREIITVATEHAAVLDTVRYTETLGYSAKIIAVDGAGLVDIEALRAAISERTALVCVMLVNNEIGVVQPIAALADIAHQAGAAFFCDAVQGYGRSPIADGCDMVALSGHKIYGPKGAGALWKRDGISLAPIMHGGGQEAGLRAGTLSPALCVGLGEAAALMAERREADAAYIERLWEAVMASGALDDWTINGSTEARYHGNLNIRRNGVDAARLMSELRDVAFSLGSACASGSGRSSHVLTAIGLNASEAKTSLRLGWGRYTKVDELVYALGQINAASQRQL